MQQIIKNVRQNPKTYLLVLFVSLAFFFVSYIPNFYELSAARLLPSDRIMLWGEHIYTYDYNVYLSKMRQGSEGRWAVVDKYDNNPTSRGALLQTLYLLAGKIGGAFRLSMTMSFHLLRTAAGLLWIASILALAFFFFRRPKQIAAAVFLGLLAGSFPVLYQIDRVWFVGMYMSWWQEMDVLKRISYLPHYTLNYSLLALMTLLMILYHQKKQKKYFLLLACLLFLSFFIHPSGGLLFLISWVIYQLIIFFWQKVIRGDFITERITKTLILFAVSAIPLLYVRFVTSVYPWKSLIDFDTTNPLPFNIHEYMMALGPIWITGIIGLVATFKNKQADFLALTTWIFAAFLGIGIFSAFPIQSPLRFVQTANHVPLALLSIYGLTQLMKKFRHPVMKYAVCCFIAIVVVIGLIHSYFSLKGQMQFIRQRAIATQPLVPYPPQVMYPLKEFYNALKWLEANTPRSGVVLSKITAGNYIPAYSGNFVYLGHNPETPHFGEREQNVKNFFSFTQTEEQAKQFLKENRIGYVFYGPQEKDESGWKNPPYSFLRPAYNTYYVTIYEVIK